jgi:dihydrofolate reductase
MRKVIVSEFMTLNGVMESPGEKGELGGRGGWTFPFWSDEAEKYKHDELLASGALLLGRVTYQLFAASWPSMTDEEGFADRMNSLPKFVVSTTLEAVEWNNSRLIKGNVAEEVSRLKQQPGQDILIAGSADLVNTLSRHGLIDEYRLMIFPVVVGIGKRLFKDGNDTTLRLVESKTFQSGVVVLHYQPDGKEVKK